MGINEEDEQESLPSVPRSIWVRWDMPIVSGHGEVSGVPIDHIEDVEFHDFCPFFPFDPFFEQEESRPTILLATGLTRVIIRHIHLIVIFAVGVVLLSPILEPQINGLGGFFPQLSVDLLLLVFLLLPMWIGLLWLLRIAGLIHLQNIIKAGAVYGIIGSLSIGTLVAVYLIKSGPENQSTNNIILTSGYFLTISVVGPLLYDTILRTENLLENLGQKNIVNNETAYEEFLDDLKTELELDFHGIPLSLPFALLFVGQFAIIWLLGKGPQGLNSSVVFCVNILFDFFLLLSFAR